MLLRPDEGWPHAAGGTERVPMATSVRIVRSGKERGGRHQPRKGGTRGAVVQGTNRTGSKRARMAGRLEQNLALQRSLLEKKEEHCGRRNI